MSACATTIPECDRLSSERAAIYLGVKPQTLAKWRSTARVRIPYIRVGKLIFYRLRDLDVWLAEQTVTCPPADDESMQ